MDATSETTVIVAANDTDTSGCAKFSIGGTITLGIVLYTVSVLTIGGNVLVITSFIREKSLRSFGNYFIVNLSVADLIIGVLMLFYIPYFITGCWRLTRAGCILFNVVDYAVPLSSTWSIAMISLDRYWSVCWAIQYRIRMTKKKTAMLMTVPWLIGFLYYGPSVVGWEHWMGEQKVPDGDCFVEFFDHVLYLLISSVVEFIIPFVVVLAINILLYTNIRNRSRGLQLNASAATTNSNQVAANQKQSLSRDRKTARSLAILVGIFLLTWAPYEICALVNPLCNFCVPGYMFDVVFWLLWINSTINPLIYALLQIKFRESFKKILTCGASAKKTTVHPLINVTTTETST